MAADLGVTPAEVNEMERRLSSRDAVFDPVPEGSDDTRIFNPSAFIPKPCPDPAAQVESADWQNDATSRMRRAMVTLDDRSRDIIENRWLTDRQADASPACRQVQRVCGTNPAD